MTMRRATLFALAAFLLPLSASAQPFERSLPASPGGHLNLRLEVGGSLRIVGWDRSEVGVVVTRSGRDAAAVDLSMDATGNQISVRSKSSRPRADAQVTYEVQVPGRFDVTIELSGGDVAISGVDGTFRGQTMGGTLTLAQLKGTVDLKTMGGDVSLTASDVNGMLQTMGGAVTVVDVSGDLEATTMGGDVTYRNVRGRSRSETRVRTMGGRISVSDAPAGTDVHTMGGDITLGTIGGYLKAETMGGTIRAESVNGWIEARTMGGDVTLKMVGSEGDRHVEVSSMGGQIDLTLPPNGSYAFDAEITVQGQDAAQYRIESAFPLTSNTSRVDEQTGGRRRLITAAGSVNGGQHRVRLRAVNGNITVRRGS